MATGDDQTCINVITTAMSNCGNKLRLLASIREHTDGQRCIVVVDLGFDYNQIKDSRIGIDSFLPCFSALKDSSEKKPSSLLVMPLTKARKRFFQLRTPHGWPASPKRSRL